MASTTILSVTERFLSVTQQGWDIFMWGDNRRARRYYHFVIYTISTEILQRSGGMGGGVSTGNYSCIYWFVYATCGVGKL